MYHKFWSPAGNVWQPVVHIYAVKELSAVPEIPPPPPVTCFKRLPKLFSPPIRKFRVAEDKMIRTTNAITINIRKVIPRLTAPYLLNAIRLRRSSNIKTQLYLIENARR
jgi:hypothetical protein